MKVELSNNLLQFDLFSTTKKILEELSLTVDVEYDNLYKEFKYYAICQAYSNKNYSRTLANLLYYRKGFYKSIEILSSLLDLNMTLYSDDTQLTEDNYPLEVNKITIEKIDYNLWKVSDAIIDTIRELIYLVSTNVSITANIYLTLDNIIYNTVTALTYELIGD